MVDTSAIPQPAAPRRRLPPQDRREQLLDAAEDLFVQRGYGGVSIQDIATAAAVTRPLVYHHFHSREGVFLACVRRARARFEDRLRAAVTVTDPMQRLRAAAETHFAALEQEPGRWQLLFASGSVLPGEHAEELARLRFTTIGVIADILQSMAPPGLPPRRVLAYAHAMSGAGERLGLWWLQCPEITREEMVSHYVSTIWDGLSALAPAPARPRST